MSKKLLAKAKRKKKVYKMPKKGQAVWEEYRNIVTVCRDMMRNAEDCLELNIVRDVKDNEKGIPPSFL